MDLRYDTPYKNDKMDQFDDDGNFKDKKNKPKSNKMDKFDDDGNYR